MKEGGLRTAGKKKKSSPQKPLISIVTVVFNNQRTIERAIRSVLSQSYRNVEYIIIDGASTDNTLSIIEQYQDRIDYYRSEEDSGIYDAMNKGLSLCTGDVIGILNSDDWYEADTAKIIADAYQKDQDSVHYGICRHHDEKGPTLVATPLAERLEDQMIAHATVFVPKHMYEAYGIFDTQYDIAADYDMMLRLYRKGKTFNIHYDVLANFEVGGTCHQNLSKSRDEIVEIKYRHSIITAKEKQKLRIKNKFRSMLSAMETSIKKFV